MVQRSLALTSLLVICFFHPMLARPRVSADLPDLKISQYEFVSTNDKRVRVQVTNEGKAASAPCRLELAIRKINGSAVTRSAYETIPALKPGKEEWVTLSATGILAAAISLKDTTFRLTVDETRIVAESNEDNNERRGTTETNSNPPSSTFIQRCLNEIRRPANSLALACSFMSIQPMGLVWPAEQYLSGYVHALKLDGSCFWWIQVLSAILISTRAARLPRSGYVSKPKVASTLG